MKKLKTYPISNLGKSLNPYNNWLEKFKYNSDWFWFDLHTKTIGKILYLYNNFKSLIYWFPIVWKDRNYDHCFLYRMLYHKLVAIEKHATNCKHYSYSKTEIRNIKIAKILCFRIYSEDYECYELDKLKDIMPKNFHCWLTYSDYLMYQDIKYLGEILTKHSKCWWD